MSTSKRERDYSSFSSAAKSRFRGTAKELGYEQITGILYVKQKNDWYEMFGLQASGWGNPFFYVNFGISTPSLCPVVDPTPIKEAGLLLASRLKNGSKGAFPNGSREEIAVSAEMVLDEYQKQAVPWFAKLDSWDEIAREYLRTNSIEESRLGAHTYEYGEDMRAATYGYLLLKAGDTENARVWLQEAERIKSLPLYTTRDGRTVHEKEKYARLQKPEDDEIESLNRVRTTLREILHEA